ncbi:sensor histidine kinase [Mucilaginibacter flavus]|uniref:sensor histidine kinase n=1 Tax=Mucilaginibacter flavus TaxID=931504 RepID=UPI0025B5DDC8|nr:HAMP domain-containing sensor histidine kinase [Mucilaginibacter flavus]MDN3580811.1 HAMP domain-containing sensor histidine kinase [Mucilaginibacter flavus]
MKLQTTTVSEKFNDMLISVLAHDLRQPFASLIAIADMVKQSRRTFTDAELHEIFEAVHYTSSVSIELLNGLLCLYKSKKDGIDYKAQSFSLANMITEANSLYVHEQMNRGITVQNFIPDSQVVFAQKEMLQFINRNILSNATKHSPAGGVIEVTCTTNNGWLTVAFRDHGKGMTSEQIRSLFAVHETGTSFPHQLKGAGVAMSICKDMINGMNGRIWAKSIHDKGTVFYYSIPQDILLLHEN